MGSEIPIKVPKRQKWEFLSCTADLAPEKVQKSLLSPASTEGKMDEVFRFFASICLFGLRTEIDTSVVLLSARAILQQISFFPLDITAYKINTTISISCDTIDRARPYLRSSRDLWWIPKQSGTIRQAYRPRRLSYRPPKKSSTASQSSSLVSSS